MHKLLYLLSSSFLCFAIIPTLMDFIFQASNPILFDGGSEGVMKYYKNSSHPPLFYLIDYPQSCSGVWSCSRLIQDLYNKHQGNGFIVIKPNPSPANLTQWLEHQPEYYIPFYSIIFSMISIGLSIIMGFLISMGDFCTKKQRMINVNDFEVDDKSWSKTKYGLYIILFALRIPVYVSVILIYTYLIPGLFVDKLPSNMKFNEYVKLFTLLAVYVIDNFVFPYEILS